MSFQAKLDALDQAWQTAEGENRDETLAALVALHRDIIKAGGTDVPAFSLAARFTCGGLYIPYLFWIALEGFIKGKDTRHELQELLRAFAESDFDPAEQSLMKPLIVTYFLKEKEFEIDRVKAHIVDTAHPAVREYFLKLIAFPEANKSSARLYSQKFHLLGAYFPNFNLYNLPLAEIEEKLKR